MHMRHNAPPHRRTDQPNRHILCSNHSRFNHARSTYPLSYKPITFHHHQQYRTLAILITIRISITCPHQNPFRPRIAVPPAKSRQLNPSTASCLA